MDRVLVRIADEWAGIYLERDRPGVHEGFRVAFQKQSAAAEAELRPAFPADARVSLCLGRTGFGDSRLGMLAALWPAAHQGGRGRGRRRRAGFALRRCLRRSIARGTLAATGARAFSKG